MTVGNRVKNYYELTKPKIWYLLVFTAFCSTATASFLFDINVSPLLWALVIFSVAAGSASADTLTGYNDRDIDKIMDRTRNRPIPSGRISPKNALAFGVVLAAISLVLAWFINPIAFGLMAFGLFDNIIVYSKWLKRKSTTNIILGGFSGGAPALIGYVAVTTQNIEIGIMMAGIVFMWIPTHIWSLALHVRKDYARAKVPMLPVVVSESTSVRVIALTTLAMVAFSLMPFIYVPDGAGGAGFGLIYLATAAAAGGLMVILCLWLLLKPSEKASWMVFKFSSPYLTAVFIALVVDAFFH